MASLFDTGFLTPSKEQLEEGAVLLRSCVSSEASLLLEEVQKVAGADPTCHSDPSTGTVQLSVP